MTEELDPDDVEDFQEPVTIDRQRSISLLAERLVQEEAEVVRLEAALSDAKERARAIREVTLPAAMLEARTRSLTLMDGTVVEVVPKLLNWGFPKGRETEGCAYLRRLGYPELIKHRIQVDVPAHQDAIAQRILQNIRSGPGANSVTITDNETIHHQTLGAFIRRRDEEGVKLDENLLGVYRANVAKVTRPKSNEEIPF